MEYHIRALETEQDWGYFADTEYATEIENGWIQPAEPGTEARQAHRQELIQFVESKPQTVIGIAETANGGYAGIIWASVSENRELWDFAPSPAWIYNVWVEPQFRRQGLGKKLLTYAKDWAKQEGFSKIGLHVLGRNSKAFHLYQAAGYTIRNSYLQKELSAEANPSCPPITCQIKACQTAKDTTQFLALGYTHFKNQVLRSQSVPEHEIRERYDTFMSQKTYKQSNHQVYVAEDAQGVGVGFLWLYTSQGDLGPQRYVWMQDCVVVNDTFRQQGVRNQLLAQAEQWTLVQGLTTIRAGVHGGDTYTWDLLKSWGYKETNYFMELAMNGGPHVS